ncbi:11556_t:CDS:2, partial [Cetraspora pellucida]
MGSLLCSNSDTIYNNMLNIIKLDDNTNELYNHHNNNIDISIIVNSDNSLDSNLDINDASQEAFSLNNNLVPSIEVEKTFTSWYDVEQYVKAYAISQDFATRLDCSKKSLGIIIRADIVCHHAVVHWINNEYHVRSANLEHNYPMDTAVTSFDPEYRKLSYNKKDQVNILFNSGVSVPTIIRMLSE